MGGQITKIKLPPRGKLKLETGENIAFLSGDVPRLVLISGSDACDIYEGQCLPSNANSPYLQNPYNFPVSAVIGFGMMESAAYSPAILDSARFYKRTCFTMGLASTVTSHATLRTGYGWMCKEGKAEINILPTSLGQRSRITILNDASADFIAAKPAGFMDVQASFYDATGAVAPNLVAVAGYFADADITAWIAAANYTGRIAQYYTEKSDTIANRFTIDAKTAVFISRDPAVTHIAAAYALDLGRNAEDFT